MAQRGPRGARCFRGGSNYDPSSNPAPTRPCPAQLNRGPRSDTPFRKMMVVTNAVRIAGKQLCGSRRNVGRRDAFGLVHRTLPTSQLGLHPPDESDVALVSQPPQFAQGCA